MKYMTLIALFALTISAHALTLNEKKKFAEWKAELSEPEKSSGKLVKDKCGISLPATIEEAFIVPFMTENTDPASYCDAARSAIASMCEDALSKAEIAKKIKKITCKLGKKEEKTLKFSGTELIFTFGLGASNLEEAVKTFLGNNL